MLIDSTTTTQSSPPTTEQPTSTPRFHRLTKSSGRAAHNNLSDSGISLPSPTTTNPGMGDGGAMEVEERQSRKVDGLKSPWKSPGWKLQEREQRRRQGLEVDEEEEEVPILSQTFSDFSISKSRTTYVRSRTSTAPSHPFPTLSPSSPSPAGAPHTLAPLPFNHPLPHSTPPRYCSTFLASPFDNTTSPTIARWDRARDDLARTAGGFGGPSPRGERYGMGLGFLQDKHTPTPPGVEQVDAVKQKIQSWASGTRFAASPIHPPSRPRPPPLSPTNQDLLSTVSYGSLASFTTQNSADEGSRGEPGSPSPAGGLGMPLSSGKKIGAVGVRSPLGAVRVVQGEGGVVGGSEISITSQSGLPRPVASRSNSSPVRKGIPHLLDNPARRSMEDMGASKIPRPALSFQMQDRQSMSGRIGGKGRSEVKKVSWDKSAEGWDTRSKDIFSFGDKPPAPSVERQLRPRRISNASGSSVNGGRVPRKRSITSATSPRAAGFGFGMGTGRVRGKTVATSSIDLGMATSDFNTPARMRAVTVDREEKEILQPSQTPFERAREAAELPTSYTLESSGPQTPAIQLAPTPTKPRASSDPSLFSTDQRRFVKLGTTSAEGSPAPIITTRKRPLPNGGAGTVSLQSSARAKRHSRSRSIALASPGISLSPSADRGFALHARASTGNDDRESISAFQLRAKGVSRPALFRRITTPAEATPTQELDMSFPIIPKRASDETATTAILSHLPTSEIRTPAPAFGDEKPSPLAFMSTGLIKKGSGSTLSTHSLPGSVSAFASAPGLCGQLAAGTSLSVASMFMRNRAAELVAAEGLHSPHIPDTPSKQMGTASMGAELPPLRLDEASDQSSPDPPDPSHMSMSPPDIPMDGSFFGRLDSGMTTQLVKNESSTAEEPTANDEVTDAVATRRPSIQIPTRGLRRKGSTMWTRTHSGSTGCGSWYGIPDGFEIEPSTPTRPDDFKVSKLDFSAVTPSPTAQTRSYPFAAGHRIDPQAPCIDSPSPPQKKASLLSRFQNNNRQRPIARASNPLLNAAYKMGEQQTSRRINTSSGLLVGSSGSPAVGKFERDFVVIEPIGKGEFSTVWKVREKRSGTVWAVKRGRPFSSARDRLRQMEEVSILTSLSEHPNPHVLSFQEAWEQNNQLHIRTGLADYGDLATYLSAIGDEGGLGEARCWKVLSELTHGLRHIHSLSILHLDLKPANVLITSTGSLRIGDFGLSTRQCGQSVPSYEPFSGSLGASDSLASLREGDREYLSPEVLRGVFDKSADMFSLGISMLEMAMNVVLPSNGEAWQKLRADDFTDLDEHFRLLDSADPAQVVLAGSSTGTSISSMSSLGSEIDTPATLSLVSPQLLAAIKGLMSSNPGTRWTEGDLDAHPVLQLIGQMSPRMSRGSVEIHPRTSTDEWEGWRRDQSFDTRSGAKDTEVEWLANGTSREVKPALIVEDEAFLMDMLHGRR